MPGAPGNATPEANVLQLGADNNFYGATSFGGPSNYGTLFKMTPAGTISWTYDFSGPPDGQLPCWYGGLTLASGGAGELYGTTMLGGANSNGKLFKITTLGAYTSLWDFTDAIDGSNPSGFLVQATDGNFYGTCQTGGAFGGGTLWKYSPSTGMVTTLHSFGSGTDGLYPTGGVIQASDGYLYGTTYEGPATIFQASTDGSVFNTLHTFTYAEGALLFSGVIQGTDGRFYGVASQGGAYGYGSVYRLSLTTLPILSSLSPSSTAAGGSSFGLTVNGAGFDCGAVVYWNTTSLTTLVDSATQLGALVPASLIASPGTASITVFQDGASTNALTFTITGAAPTLSSLSPSSALAGSAGFTLTVNGSGFDSTAAVHWNGASLPTSFVSAPELTASVPASDITTAGTASISVTQDTGASGSLTFTINNPMPVLSSIKPTSTNAGGPAFTLTVKGSAFVSGSTIHWNSTPLTTTFVSATKLTASVPASLIASSGTASITVVSPSPGGGTSTSKSFKVLLTTVKLTSTSTVVNPDGSYTVTAALDNVGYYTAPSVTIKKAKLGAAATSSMLPMSVGSIAAGATATAILNFPASAGTPGSVVKLAVSGTFMGGTFAGTLNVTLP